MNRGLKIGVVPVCLLAAAIAVYVSSERQPSVRGKTLEEWAAIYMRDAEGPAQSADTPAAQEAVLAVRSVVNETIRWAIKHADYEKPPWKSSVVVVMERVNIRKWGPKAIWVPFYRDPSDKVVVYFQMLGPDGSPAIPELVKIMNRTESPLIVRRVLDALSYVGKDAMPVFEGVLSEKGNPNRRLAIVMALAANRREPGIATATLVRLLIECLDDLDPQLPLTAICALGDLALEPESAVPALIQPLLNGNQRLRQAAAEALQKFGKESRPALPALRRALDDPAHDVRATATNALRQADFVMLSP